MLDKGGYMTDKGFIKLNRQLMEWRWYQDANTTRVFIHLLFCANIEDRDFRNVRIKRGECATSFNSLGEALGLSIQSIRTSLAHLESTGEITRKKYSKFQVISIVNYDSYQSKPTDKSTGNQQATNNQLTGNQQQLKNKKNIRMEEDIVPKGTCQNINQTVVDLFNSICVSLPKVQKLTDTRRKAIAARLSENDNSIEELKAVFEAAERSDFLSGRSGAWSCCSFDWIMKKSNFIKINEGNYENARNSKVTQLNGNNKTSSSKWGLPDTAI